MPAYQQSEPYMSRTDAGFRDWLTNFSTLLSSNPSRYGVTAADAAVIAGHQAAYDPLYVACQSAATRTTQIVQQKDAAKASAMGSCQVYAMIIKKNEGVTDDDKVALGLHVDDNTRTPIPAPSSAPILMLQGAFSGEHQLRYADENTPASRAKPHGVMQIQINRTIETGANPDPNDSEFVGLYTKQPILIAQNPTNVGLTATYFGRWVTRTGLTGPWSLPVGMTIAFGGAVDAQAPTGGTSQTAEGGDGLQIAA